VNTGGQKNDQTALA